MVTEIGDDDEEEEQYDDEFDEQFEYDNMTTIRMQRHSSQRKWFWAALMLILVAVAALLLFVKPLGLSQNVRKSPSKTDANDVKPKEDNNASRDITFEVTNLDGQEGSTDTFVVRTQPDWSPLGVEQFHVSYTQECPCVCNLECYIFTLILSLNLLYILLLSRN